MSVYKLSAIIRLPGHNTHDYISASVVGRSRQDASNQLRRELALQLNISLARIKICK